MSNDITIADVLDQIEDADLAAQVAQFATVEDLEQDVWGEDEPAVRAAVARARAAVRS
jgi:hypothetical protein